MSTKRKTPAKLAPPVLKQSAKQAFKTRIDESRTAVTAGKVADGRGILSQETVEISSDSSDDDDDMSTGEADHNQKPTVKASQNQETNTKPSSINTKSARLPNGKAATPEDAPGSDSEPQSPTLGELARNRTVDVQEALQQQQQGSSLTTAPNQAVAPPSLQSLGTVLTQALRSDDTELLESCLQTTDLNAVRATIQRLDSGLAASLLTRLASRMHRRPGRASTLISWVQWTLIAHGGALAAQPDLQRKLAELNRVLEERSRGLNSLLVLKGKLDMLEAQMQLRRGASRSGRGRNTIARESSSEEETEARNVVYVEGEEDQTKDARAEVDDDQFDISAVNGVDSDSDDEDEDEDMDDANELRRAAGAEVLDDDEVDFDDVDDESGEDDSDVDAAAPPAKVQKTSSAFPKRR
ncbi:hypothetical protein MGG_08924 [Pyricularia oryzae 70-15]|uniref:Small-subunit processome Utp12 domain-containing protein n=3 Tax=Pyricularia oryzae TaxID=318829 RepID=G4MVN9_PYRO7|nr:uncharacterized protein MGG_08924 [Pyricularia oryzae 70-15]EHA54148.1 hypothetical protein MGG_08924 [Pyricularia oryzae 70-15]ELQ42012.1 hypothetical protein OOU_Y34scaffold00240g19 [Pyricularia oryzae Y34]KAI7930835.1 hypothetical protein M9X92_000515 [Pyricularia oryzae]KAI7932454.1 hypothetical protein M0657_000584 [Pyricularia oryzae]